MTAQASRPLCHHFIANFNHLRLHLSIESQWGRKGPMKSRESPWKFNIWARVDQLLVLGMGNLQPLIGNPYNGYINPYYWVDDHPLLYGNIGSLDPSTYHPSKLMVGRRSGFLLNWSLFRGHVNFRGCMTFGVGWWFFSTHLKTYCSQNGHFCRPGRKFQKYLTPPIDHVMTFGEDCLNAPENSPGPFRFRHRFRTTLFVGVKRQSPRWSVTINSWQRSLSKDRQLWPDVWW